MAIEITSQSLAGTPSEEPAVYKESPARALSGFLPRISPSRALDFGIQLRDGPGAILAAVPVHFLAGKSSFFRCPKADAHGFVLFCAHTSASASVLSLRCGRNVTASQGFPG